MLPSGVMKSMRAPSYKAIALAILKNDHNMYSLGFGERESRLCDFLIESKRIKEVSPNHDLFHGEGNA